MQFLPGGIQKLFLWGNDDLIGMVIEAHSTGMKTFPLQDSLSYQCF